MGRLVVVAFFSVLAVQPLVGHGFSRAAAGTPQFSGAELASATVIMSRENRCSFFQELPTDLNQCPTFTVGLSGDGAVTYIGRSGVGMIGTLTHKIPVDSARGLIREFLGAGFFDFKDTYQSVDHVVFTRSIDHAIGTTLTLSIGKRSKSVYAFYGVPHAIKELERRVEDVTDVRRYTGRPPPPVGPHAVSGRITADNGSALAGVTVSMRGPVSHQAVTDNAGRYRIDGVFAGNRDDDYLLMAAAEGFVTAAQRVGIKEGALQLEWNPSLAPYSGPPQLQELLTRLNLFAGSNAVNCGQYLLADGGGNEADAATIERFLACAADARAKQTPFRVVVQQRGFNSWVAQGVVSGPGLAPYLYTYDHSGCSAPTCSPSLSPQLCGRFEATTDAKGKVRIACAGRRDPQTN